MKQGIVMKVYKEYSVVLAEKTYYRVNNKEQMTQGQTILFSNEDLYNRTEQRSDIMKKFRPFVAIAAALLIMISGGLFLNQQTVASYVVVDINPSVQLEVDSNEIVIGYSALNEDAGTLQLDYIIGLSVEKAVEYIAMQAEEAGFLNTEDLEDDYILVSTISEENSDDVRALLEALKESSEMMKGLNVAIINASENEMDDALENGLPVGLVAAEEGDLEFPTVKEYFADDENREDFEEDGSILSEDFGHEIERVNAGLMNAAMNEEIRNELMADFLAAKDAFFVAKDDFTLARDAYKEALESGTEEEIAAAKLAMEEAEAYKDQMEAEKDAVEEVKDLLMAELDDEERELELEQIALQLEARMQERMEEAEEREEAKEEREQERLEDEEEREEEKAEREQERLEDEEEREEDKAEREEEREEDAAEREAEKAEREQEREDAKEERENNNPGRGNEYEDDEYEEDEDYEDEDYEDEEYDEVNHEQDTEDE